MTAAPLVQEQETDGEAEAVAVCSKFVCASVYVRAFVSNVSLYTCQLFSASVAYNTRVHVYMYILVNL
jgi:hypothetical protein